MNRKKNKLYIIIIKNIFIYIYHYSLNNESLTSFLIYSIYDLDKLPKPLLLSYF